MGGTHPIIGATVSLWSAGTTAAQVGTSVTTNASGQFSMSYDCATPGALMYVTATSGHIGSGAANAHIRLVSAIGACSGLPASIVVNELTSTAAAYALSCFAPTAGTTAVSFQGKSPGINQAFLTLTNLVVPATGTVATAGRENNLTVMRQRLNTVANALAACDVSAVAGACAELFSCARANAHFVATGQACTTGTSTTTTDTMNAALAIVQNAGLVSATGIFDVASTSTSFGPALGAAPAQQK
jgi:hypothetical protein